MTAGGDVRMAGGRFDRLRSSARYGRLRARLPRYAFLIVVLLLCVLGLRSLLVPAGSGSDSFAAPGPPVDYAEQSFALTFARAYLTYDAANPEAHEAELAALVPDDLGVEAGFVPPSSGSQTVEWAQIAQAQRPLAGGVILTVAAKVSTASVPLYLSVPVERGEGGAIYLSGYPSFVGPPLSMAPPVTDQGGQVVDDDEVGTLVERALSNYLAGDSENLAADLAGAATVTLPTNLLTLKSMDELEWVGGAEGSAVLATVDVADELGGRYTLRYEVGVRRPEAVDPQLGPAWRVTYFQALSHQS